MARERKKREGRMRGIDLLGDVSWGAHWCLFYETKEDLIEILVPYFKAGLENNEFCMWVTSEPLRVEDAEESLRRAVKNLDDYIQNGQIEIRDYSQWYTKSGTFEPDRVLQGWVEKENQALERGFDGLRLTGNTFWLEKGDWKDFADYEATVDHVIREHRLIALCTYSLDKCGASEIMDVVSSHQFALVRREGKWEIVQSAERKRAQEALRESEAGYKELADSITDVFFAMDKDLRYTYWNKASEELMGISAKDAIGKSLYDLFPDTPQTRRAERVYLDVLRTQQPQTFVNEYQLGGKDFVFEISAYPSRDGLSVFVKDITERKQAEETLAHERDLFHSLMDNIPDRIYFKDTQSHFVRVSKALADMHGLSDPTEAVGKTDFDFFAEEQARQFYANEQEVMRSGQPLVAKEEKEIWLDGRETWCLTSIMPFHDKKGEIIGTFGISRDITERKQAEEALRESEEKYRTILENIEDGYFEVDIAGNFTFFNDSLCRIIGYSRDEMMGMNNRQYMDDETAKAVYQAFNAVYRTGKPAKIFGYGIIQKDGTRRSVETSVSLISGSRGEPAGFRGIVRDITERKKAEEELKTEKMKLESYIESMSDGVVILNLKGEVLNVNKAYSRIFGREKGETVGKSAFSIGDLPKKEFLGALSMLKEIIQKGSVENRELTLLNKEKKEVPILFSAVLIKDSRGKPESIFTVFKNIAERKRTEEALRESEEKYRDVVERANDGIIIIQETIIRYANPRLAEMWGGTVEEFIGTPFTDHVHPDELPKVVDRYKGRMAGKDVTPIYETVLRRKDGSKLYAELNAGIIIYQGKSADLVIVRDITERKREEEELRRRVTELATFNEIGRAIAATMKLDQLWDLIYHQTCRVMEVSAFYISLYDRQREELNVVIDILDGQRQPQEEGPRKFHKGRTEYIIRTKKPLLIRGEVQETYDRLGITPSDKRAKGFAGVPITARGEVIGVLAVQNYERDEAYDEHTIDLLSTIANQAAIAIENARLYEETQKRLAETTLLHKVAEAINATLDLKEIFQRVVEELSRTFDYRLADIYLLEGEGLRLQANVGYDAQTILEAIPLARGVVGRVARTGQPAFIRDVSQDPDYIPSYPDITSEICVPIKSGETLLGVLNVECDECRFLTEDDLLLLRTLSSHIGVAIENARLYEEEQRRSAQRRTIAEVGRRAASILEMDALLPQVVDLIALNFGYDHVHIFQIDPDSEYAVYKAGTGKAGLAIAEEGLRLKVGEEGIIGWVAQHGQPLLGNDVSLDPYYISHPALPDTRSELAAPIRVGGRIIGILDVQSTKLNAFDEGDLETLQTLADQLAVAMENARLYEETKRLAITDGLTGLYNLRYFYEALEKEIQRSERYHRSISLVILDIDDLKAYNDLYGHLAGDDLLKELAQLMSKVTRRADTSARYGGDEFAIILPETGTEGARLLAERLLEEVKEHRFSTQNGQTIGRTTTSLGIATYPHHADSAKALVEAADKALLRAKGAGKNQLSVCEEELTEIEPR